MQATGMASERRPLQFKILLSEEEKTWLEKIAASRGLTSSDVLRLYIRDAHLALSERNATQASKAGKKSAQK